MKKLILVLTIGTLAPVCRGDDAQIAAQRERIERERIENDARMSEEMARHRARVERDYAKQREAARKLALAVAERFDAPKQIPNSTDVTNGRVTDHYDNTNPLFASSHAREFLENYFKRCDEKEAEFQADRAEDEGHR